MFELIVLILALVNIVLLYFYVAMLIGDVVAILIMALVSAVLKRPFRGEKLIDVITMAEEVFMRYCTIPYLVTLPMYIVSGFILLGEDRESTLSFLWNVAMHVYFGWMFYQNWRNRKKKDRKPSRILARVKNIGHKLVVEQVPVGGSALTTSLWRNRWV